MSAGWATIAIPCRTDEPGLERTLARALEAWRRAPLAATRLEVLVCLNGPGGRQLATALAAFARAQGIALVERDLDDPAAPPAPAAGDQLAMEALTTRRVGKAIAWNLLRGRARGRLGFFLDADVDFAPDTFALLLAGLASAPGAVIASARTICAPRAGLFERIMAAPYGVDFPNLSPQLYAARVDALPRAMPEDLIEPERWLELTVGREAIVRVPAARVVVRLPGTLADFFRQRIRIEMGKVQMRREYAALLPRSARQPGARAALASLDARDTLRLAAYLALRGMAHARAWWRYRRGRSAGIWRQAGSTKDWSAP